MAIDDPATDLRLSGIHRALPPDRAAALLEVSKRDADAGTGELAGGLVAALAIALSAYALYWVVAIIPAQVYRPSFLAIARWCRFCCIPSHRATTRTAWTRDWLTAVLPVVALGIVFANYFAARPQLDLSPAGWSLLVPGGGGRLVRRLSLHPAAAQLELRRWTGRWG